jgi:hypothetical protein
MLPLKLTGRIATHTYDLDKKAKQQATDIFRLSDATHSTSKAELIASALSSRNISLSGRQGLLLLRQHK